MPAKPPEGATHLPALNERQPVYTIGHSTRSQDEFIQLLRRHGIVTLVDIRRFPRSARNPQFNTAELAGALARAGITYMHEERLGGRRRSVTATEANAGWRNPSFRAFADYMASEEFAAGLAAVLEQLKRGPVAIMCSEALPWRCHRGLVADALIVRGIPVFHIQSGGRAPAHVLTPFAQVDGRRLTYPAQ